MKKLISLFALACAFTASAALDVIEVPTGEAVRCPYAAKVVSAQALSSVAAGTATAKCVSSWETWASSNVVTTVTNTFSNLTTNYITVVQVTNAVRYVSSRVVNTNSLTAAITCSAGVGTGSAASFPYVAPGEPIFIDGTAKGRVLLFVER